MDDSVTIAFYSRECTLIQKHAAKIKSSVSLHYVERNCFSNCVNNMEAMETLAGCALTVVAGSLGLCAPPPTWYEWGGYGDAPHTTVKQFVSCPVTGLPDVHFWFEAADGNIWDVLDLYLLNTVAPTFKKTVDRRGLVHGYFVNGKPASELESIGLKYVKTTPLVEEILVRRHISNVTVKKFM